MHVSPPFNDKRPYRLLWAHEGQTRREEGHVRTEVQTVLMEPPEARSKDRFLSPSDFGGSTAHGHLDFGLPTSRTMRKYISAILRHLVFDDLLWQL